jgi:hypothetical protein
MPMARGNEKQVRFFQKTSIIALARHEMCGTHSDMVV